MMTDRSATLSALAALLMIGLAAPAVAQTPAPSDAAKNMVGAWELSDADHEKTCTVNFKLTPAGGNYALEPDKKCGDVFPGIRGIAGWTFGRTDNLVLTDTAGKQVLELLEVEAGIYEGLRPNEGRYILQNAAVAAASRDRPADDLFGEWSVVRSAAGTGKPVCSLTLANTAATADSFAVTVKPGCDQQIARFGPASWRMERGQLVMQSGRGEVWRFEESGDPNTWTRVPASRGALSLVRQ